MSRLSRNDYHAGGSREPRTSGVGSPSNATSHTGQASFLERHFGRRPRTAGSSVSGVTAVGSALGVSPRRSQAGGGAAHADDAHVRDDSPDDRDAAASGGRRSILPRSSSATGMPIVRGQGTGGVAHSSIVAAASSPSNSQSGGAANGSAAAISFPSGHQYQPDTAMQPLPARRAPFNISRTQSNTGSTTDVTSSSQLSQQHGGVTSGSSPSGVSGSTNPFGRMVRRISQNSRFVPQSSSTAGSMATSMAPTHLSGHSDAALAGMVAGLGGSGAAASATSLRRASGGGAGSAPVLYEGAVPASTTAGVAEQQQNVVLPAQHHSTTSSVPHSAPAAPLDALGDASALAGPSSSSSSSQVQAPPAHRIRLVPHLEASRSLHFEPIERDLVEGQTAIKIGRFTDRGGHGASGGGGGAGGGGAGSQREQQQHLTQASANVPSTAGGATAGSSMTPEWGAVGGGGSGGGNVPPASAPAAGSTMVPPPPRLNTSRVAFKSKVVSRGHAEMWYDKGKFWLRDTKSSSGTFLNHIRLSAPNVESKPHEVRDGDVVQLGVDYQGGTEEIYRCVKMRVELNRDWQRGANSFNINALRQLRALQGTSIVGKSVAGADAGKTTNRQSVSVTDCCICLFSVTVCQALFIAPCSHVFHYKCIRPLLNMHHPGFSCPLCRTFADLEADVEQDEAWQAALLKEVALAEGSGALAAATSAPVRETVPAEAAAEAAAGPAAEAAEAMQVQQDPNGLDVEPTANERAVESIAPEETPAARIASGGRAEGSRRSRSRNETATDSRTDFGPRPETAVAPPSAGLPSAAQHHRHDEGADEGEELLHEDATMALDASLAERTLAANQRYTSPGGGERHASGTSFASPDDALADGVRGSNGAAVPIDNSADASRRPSGSDGVAARPSGSAVEAMRIRAAAQGATRVPLPAHTSHSSSTAAMAFEDAQTPLNNTFLSTLAEAPLPSRSALRSISAAAGGPPSGGVVNAQANVQHTTDPASANPSLTALLSPSTTAYDSADTSRHSGGGGLDVYATPLESNSPRASSVGGRASEGASKLHHDEHAGATTPAANSAAPARGGSGGGVATGGGGSGGSPTTEDGGELSQAEESDAAAERRTQRSDGGGGGAHPKGKATTTAAAAAVAAAIKAAASSSPASPSPRRSGSSQPQSHDDDDDDDDEAATDARTRTTTRTTTRTDPALLHQALGSYRRQMERPGVKESTAPLAGAPRGSSRTSEAERERTTTASTPVRRDGSLPPSPPAPPQ